MEGMPCSSDVTRVVIARGDSVTEHVVTPNRSLVEQHPVACRGGARIVEIVQGNVPHTVPESMARMTAFSPSFILRQIGAG